MTVEIAVTTGGLAHATTSSIESDELAQLREVLRTSPHFRTLGDRHFDALVRTARFHRLPSEHVVAQDGGRVDRLFLVVTGEVEAFWGEELREVLHGLTRGGVFGEGLFHGEPHLCSFETQSETVLATWDADALHCAERAVPGLEALLTVSLSKEARRAELDELLRHAPLFRNSSPVLRHRLLDETTLLRFAPGTFVYRAGEPANYGYLVVRGEVELRKKGTDETIAILERGASFGEVDLFGSATRTESAEAKYETEVLALDRGALEALRRACGSVRRALSERVGSGYPASVPQEVILVVDLVPARARAIASLVRDAFAASGEKDVAMLEVAPEGHGTPASDDVLTLPSDPTRAIELLDQRSARSGGRYGILYTAIENALAWLATPLWETIIGLRIASAIYVVEDARRSLPIAEPRLAPAQYLELRARRGAPATHGGRSNTIRLSIDAPVRYEALSAEDRAALQRLARTVSRRTIGVALGGGSAWCYAHVALLRALHEAGIPIDRIAGTSIGAIIGCAYASRGLDGLDALIASRIETAFRLAFLPVTRKPLERWIERCLLDHRCLQDMPLRMLPVAVDIQTGRVRIFRHGPAAPAMFASAACPTVFAPQIFGDGVRYVDGGIANNVPVTALVREGVDFIIASNVIPRPDRLTREVHKGDASRILSQLSPLGRIRDGFRSMLFVMHEAGARQAAGAHVVFTPSLGKFGICDYHIAHEIVEHVQPELPRFIDRVKDRYAAFCRARG